MTGYTDMRKSIDGLCAIILKQLQTEPDRNVVYTVSCNRFASVRQVYTFARFCHERGIILHFVAEPYLDIGNGKQWRPAVAKVIASMVESGRKQRE